MAIIKRSSFVLVFSALMSSVSGQTGITFDRCGRSEDDRLNNNDASFDTNRGGSQRRTYGNLCGGTQPAGSTANDDNLESRIGHDFRVLCDLIDDNPNILALMSTGNSPHTIFAPTDAAFAKVDGLIARVNKQRLLELHFIPQARLARDLRCGQTYRTVNTNQSRRDNQRSKTRCVSAGRAQQLGPGNVVNGLKPTIGFPDNIFKKDEFTAQRTFNINFNEDDATAADRETFSQDVISCNGVIHVVDEVLLPGGNNAFRNSGGYNGLYGSSRPNYYGGTSHTHGAYYGGHTHGAYYGGAYYNAGPGYYYAPAYYRSRAGGGYYSKGTKKGKGAKGGKGFNVVNPQQAAFFQQPYYRRLEGDYQEDAFEMPMSDAEFFGTSELNNEDGEAAEAGEDHSNRKRRLEAMLEPDGNIEQV